MHRIELKRLFIYEALPEMSPWLLLWLMAPAGARRLLIERAYGAGKPGLNLDNIRSLPIFVPPLDEQRAVIAQVSAIALICNELETRLIHSEGQRRKAFEMIVRKALEQA